MDEKGILELERQMRENSDELKDYLFDLKNWEEEMKEKDRLLHSEINHTQSALPPIRNQISKRKKKKKPSVEKGNGTVPKTKRISSYDYSSWDKFDVDAALQELDDKENKELNSSGEEAEDDSEDEELEMERRKQKAQLEKDKGNDYFKQGKYDEAIACYTVGIENDPTNAILSANRAMALLKKGQLAAAESDCDLALTFDPTYVKAYLRRGAARFGLKKFESAKEDFERVLEIDSENKQAKMELSKVKKELEKLTLSSNDVKSEESAEKGKQTLMTSIECRIIENSKQSQDGEDDGIIMPVNKPPHLRSKKPLKRVKIREVLSDSEDWNTEEATAKVSDSNSSPFASLITSIARCSGSNKKDTTAVPSIPQTAYQFYADWRALRNHSDKQYQYLRQIPPEQIPKLFKQSMDTEVFSSILTTINKYFIQNGDDVFMYLKYLTQVGRFATLAMFLSDSEQKGISDMLSVVKSSKSYLEEEVSAVEKSYGIKCI